MPLSGTLTCGLCGIKAEIRTMKYDLSGTKLICPSCISKQRGGAKPGTTQLERGRLLSAMEARLGEEQAIQELKADMVNYYCSACGFRFSRKSEFDVRSCPYCGKETVSKAFTGKAQQLIEEAVSDDLG